jgi:hypothetical protein
MLVEITMLSDPVCVCKLVFVCDSGSGGGGWMGGWGGLTHPVQLEIQHNNCLLKLTVHNSVCYTYCTQKSFHQLFYVQQSNILSKRCT